MKKRIIAVLLIVCVMVPVLTNTAWAATIVESGQCGRNVTWNKDSAGVVTISGAGPMKNYNVIMDFSPWHMSSAKTVKIEEGVTTIGSCAFGWMFTLKTLTIPKSVVAIGSEAFINTWTITDVYYAGTESDWNNIKIYSGNYTLNNATIHYNATGPGSDVPSPSPTPEKIEIRCNGQPSEYFDHNLDYLVSNTNSNTYSAEISRMMIALCNAVHNESDISDAYHSLGFENDDVTRKPLQFITYNVGTKQMENGKKLVLVAVRGSVSVEDWISNFDVRLDFSGLHQGFSDASDEIYETIKQQLGGEDFDNTVFVITGHSRGGAAANLLEYKLMNKGVPQSNLCGYNFASPDVAVKFGTEWNPSGRYDNIMNISNAADCVPMLPGVIGNQILPHLYGTTWGKFGQSVWFSQNWNDVKQNGGQRTMGNHPQNVYLGYLKNNPTFSSFKTWFEMQANVITTQLGNITTQIASIGKIIGICCPVDVMVKDPSGQPIASVIDGKVDYFDSDFGNVIIFTDGEHKAIYVQGDTPLTVELTATNNGTMDYTIQTVDLGTGGILSDKHFENVSLTKGKQMVSLAKNNSDHDVSDSSLYVLNSAGQPEKEVLPDGKGTEVPVTPGETWSNPFTDVKEDAWYYEAVRYAYENGLMKGTASQTFAPRQNLSRSMLAQILYNKEGKPAFSSVGGFSDVTNGAWYASAVSWAAGKGIVSGYGNGCFGPNDPITREQLATMLWRYAGKPAASATLSFTDADKISSYALDAMKWAVENGVMNGKGAGILDPGGKATRAEVAQMLKNYLG